MNGQRGGSRVRPRRIAAGPARRHIGVIAGAFALERPLLLQQLGLRIELPDSRHRQRDLVGSQSRQQHVLDQGVHWQGPHFLAARAAILGLVCIALIERIVAAWSRIAQCHAPAAAAADGDALQQGPAATWSAWPFRCT